MVLLMYVDMDTEIKGGEVGWVEVEVALYRSLGVQEKKRVDLKSSAYCKRS